jgi:hypothetical protein
VSRPGDDAEAGFEPLDRALDESRPVSVGSLVGAIGQMATAVLLVVAIVALFVAVAVALRWVFWR